MRYPCAANCGANLPDVWPLKRMTRRCRSTPGLHDNNPYGYFVDVLQRIGQHPASLVLQLTPRIWKRLFLFTSNPLRSDLHDLAGRRTFAGV